MPTPPSPLDPATVEACARLVEDEGPGLLLPAAYKRLAARIRALTRMAAVDDHCGVCLHAPHAVGSCGAPIEGLPGQGSVPCGCTVGRALATRPPEPTPPGGPARSELVQILYDFLEDYRAASWTSKLDAVKRAVDAMTAALEADRLSRGTPK